MLEKRLFVDGSKANLILDKPLFYEFASMHKIEGSYVLILRNDKIIRLESIDKIEESIISENLIPSFSFEILDTSYFSIDTLVKTYNNMSISREGEEIFFLSKEENKLIIYHTLSSKISMINLYDRISQNALLDRLGLDDRDKMGTLENLGKGEDVPLYERFFNVSTIKRIDGHYYLSVRLNTVHHYSEKEILQLPKKYQKMAKDKKQGIETTVSWAMLLILDANFNLIKDYTISESGSYYIREDVFSKTENGNFIFNISYMGGKKNFEDSCFVMAEFTLKDDELVMDKILPQKLPKLYFKKLFRDFSLGFFSNTRGEDFFALRAYPYVIDIKSSNKVDFGESEYIKYPTNNGITVYNQMICSHKDLVYLIYSNSERKEYVVTTLSRDELKHVSTTKVKLPSEYYFYMDEQILLCLEGDKFVMNSVKIKY